MGEYDYVPLERAKANVIVAWTRDVAIQYRDAFNLDANQWACLGVGQRLPGKPWQRLVMIRPHWNLSPAEAIEFEMLVQNWRTMTYADSVFKLL
jgi:hypothetical protein